MQYIYDTHMTLARQWCKCLKAFVQMSLSFIFSQLSQELSYSCHNFTICSHCIRICIAYLLQKLNCVGSAKGLRRVCDTCDDFAIVLRGLLSHNFF